MFVRLVLLWCGFYSYVSVHLVQAEQLSYVLLKCVTRLDPLLIHLIKNSCLEEGKQIDAIF